MADMHNTSSENSIGTNVVTRLHNRIFNEFKRGQMGYSTIAIIGQSCLGSAAAMVLLMGKLDKLPTMVLLFLVTILCMAFNGAVLAQLKPLTTFNLLLASVIFNVMVIFAHII